MSVAAPRAGFRAERRGPIASRERLLLVAVGVLTLVAFLLRLSQIHQSLAGDEAFGTYPDLLGRGLWSTITEVHTGAENSPPLYFILAWFSAKLGDASVWIRLPSLILGTATVPLLYLLGREAVGPTAGVIAAAIYALSPFAVWYGDEARPYATMMFFVVVSTFALLRAVSTRSRWWWILYAFAAAGAAYSHYTCVFVLGVQVLWSLWACRDRLREPILANALVVLLYLPWLPQLRGKQVGIIGGLYPLSWRVWFRDVARLIPGHPSVPLHEIPTYFGEAAIGLCLLLALVLLVGRHRGSLLRPRLGSPLFLLVASAAVTPIGLALYSIYGTPLFLPRGLLASFPAMALVFAALLVSLPRRLSVLAVAVVLVTLLSGTIRSFVNPDFQRPLHREVAEYLDSVAGPTDPVVLIEYTGVAPIKYQVRKSHRFVKVTGPVRRDAAPGQKIFLVVDQAVGRLLHFKERRPGFKVVARKHFGGSLPSDVLTYQRQPTSG